MHKYDPIGYAMSPVSGFKASALFDFDEIPTTLSKVI